MLEVIIGPMFSGKSTELIRKLTRAQIAGKKVIMFKPKVDDRYHDHMVVSHDGSSFPATVVDVLSDIRDVLEEDAYDVLGFDEAQFFNYPFENYAQVLAQSGHHVIVSGLSTDFMGRPWTSMIPLVFRADELHHLTAVCLQCGSDATRNQRIVNGEPATSGELTAIGGTESYEARCSKCFVESGVKL